MLIGCVDARSIFTNVSVGEPGSVGDAYAFNRSQLQARLVNGNLGDTDPQVVDDTAVGSYIVSDSAFALSSIMMKCYEAENLLSRQKSFIFCIIHA